jgi:uncharacterized membrane protein
MKFLLAMLLLTSLTLASARRKQFQNFQEEAVERGFAEWVVTDNGSKTFKWKEGQP